MSDIERRRYTTPVAAVLSVLAAISLGVIAWKTGISSRTAIGEGTAPPPGRWRPDPRPPSAGLDADDPTFGLPYAPGTHPASSRSGVTVHDGERAWEGYNLLVSGHAPEAILMDMRGKTLHTWSGAGLGPGKDRRRAAAYWRRARLLEDGGLLAIHEGSALIRLDSSSRVMWRHECECHHDLDLDPGGNILVLDRREVRSPGRPTALVDYIVTLGPEGDPIDELSVLDCFERSAHAGLLSAMSSSGDLLHTNSLTRLDGRLATDKTPFLAEGNLLISAANVDIVAIVDPRAREVVWVASRLWHRQHDPVLLDTGNIMVFDNLAPRGGSRVIELDPATMEIRWEYRGSETSPFYTETCGTSQRLPNGNTLITESDRGRAFEVTADGEIVWEYLSPHRAGDDGELVATLFELTRIPIGFPIPAAAGDSSNGTGARQ